MHLGGKRVTINDNERLTLIVGCFLSFLKIIEASKELVFLKFLGLLIISLVVLKTLSYFFCKFRSSF